MNSIFKGFHQVESNFFSMMSVNKVHYDNLTAFVTGVPVPPLNPAIVHQVNNKFQDDLDSCTLFYSEQKMPWALVIPEYLCNKSLKHQLQNHHLNLSDEGVAMSLALKDIKPNTSTSNLQIKTMEHDLKTWSIPLLHGFESTPALTNIYTHQHQLASKNASSIYHFSGFIDDTIVSSLTLSLWEGKARLDDIATMPDFQKQGFATALIYAALDKAARLNIKDCYLEASASGLNVYKKIGFKPIFKNYYYELDSSLLK